MKKAEGYMENFVSIETSHDKGCISWAKRFEAVERLFKGWDTLLVGKFHE